MIIEGKNAVRELIASGATINKLLIQKNLKDSASNQIISLAKQFRIRIDFVDKQILDNKSPFKKHQGFICETVEYNYAEVSDMLKKAQDQSEHPFILILDGIEDPHNFGAIIRTAECAGVHGIIIPTHRACSVNDTVMKTSAGAAVNMLIARVTNLNMEIENLKKQNIWVYALEVGGQEMYKTNLKGAVALVVGGEGSGVRRLTKELCDGVVSLPLKGKINSLNASVATGIAIYEILKQR